MDLHAKPPAALTLVGSLLSLGAVVTAILTCWLISRTPLHTTSKLVFFLVVSQLFVFYRLILINQHVGIIFFCLPDSINFVEAIRLLFSSDQSEPGYPSDLPFSNVLVQGIQFAVDEFE